MFCLYKRILKSPLTSRLVFEKKVKTPEQQQAEARENKATKNLYRKVEQYRKVEGEKETEATAVNDRTKLRGEMLSGEVEKTKARMLGVKDAFDKKINEWLDSVNVNGEDGWREQNPLNKLLSELHGKDEKGNSNYSPRRIKEIIFRHFGFQSGVPGVTSDSNEMSKGFQLWAYNTEDFNKKTRRGKPAIDGNPGFDSIKHFTKRVNFPVPKNYSGIGATRQERMMSFAEMSGTKEDAYSSKRAKELKEVLVKDPKWYVRKINQFASYRKPEDYNINDWALITDYKEELMKEGDKDKINAFNQAVEELGIDFSKVKKYGTTPAPEKPKEEPKGQKSELKEIDFGISTPGTTPTKKPETPSEEESWDLF